MFLWYEFFGGVSICIVNLIDKLDTRRFGGMLSLGVRAVRKDSYVAECVGKDLKSLLLCRRVICLFKLNKCALRRYACKTC